MTHGGACLAHHGHTLATASTEAPEARAFRQGSQGIAPPLPRRQDADSASVSGPMAERFDAMRRSLLTWLERNGG